MKHFLTIILILTISSANSTAWAWGRKGHDVIAGIAETHLTKKAKKQVRELLEGKTMIYYSSWMDEIRGDSIYQFTTTWHYANVDEGKTYETMIKHPDGDVVTATLLSIKMLKDKTQSDSIRSMYLKFLIHLIGDLHCPMHAGRATDLGGNLYPVTWRNQETNLHRLWDSPIVDAAKTWSYLEWCINIDLGINKKQKKTIAAGDPLSWFNETVAIAKDVYENSPKNGTIPSDYVRNYTPVIEKQFLYAGHRLAYLLNDIFD